jgi:hypothetical protein
MQELLTNKLQPIELPPLPENPLGISVSSKLQLCKICWGGFRKCAFPNVPSF